VVPEAIELWVTSHLLVAGGDGDDAGTILEHRVRARARTRRAGAAPRCG
jgi:hypothetical protein